MNRSTATIILAVLALAFAHANPATAQGSKSSQSLEYELALQRGTQAVIWGVPAGKGNNWLQTVPGEGWKVIFRLYGPLKPWFDKTWRPGEIELVA